VPPLYSKSANKRPGNGLGSRQQSGLSRPHVPALCGEDDLGSARPHRLSKQYFTLALRIEIRRVEEIYAGVDRGIYETEFVTIRRRARKHTAEP
jgi:hypothetical protein